MLRFLPSEATTVAKKKRSTVYGRPLDLHTLSFALSDNDYSLERACDAFAVEHKKPRRPKLGTVTDKLIRYCQGDVQATADLYAEVIAECRRHPIKLDPLNALSPATIARVYLEALGVQPILARQPDFDRHVLGYAMAAYFGGRTECLIRRTPVPVTVLDVRSTYPTVCALLGIFDLLTASRVEVVDATEDARGLLERITLRDCLEQPLWRSLVGLVKVHADGSDVLPLRARFSGNPQWEMAVATVGSDEGIWIPIADAVASKLRTGRPPVVLEAIRFSPSDDKLEGLRRVRLRGEVEVDPYVDDLFKVCVEQRERVRRQPGEQAKRLQQFLKTFQNAAGYGIYVEFRRRDLPGDQQETVNIWGRHDQTWQKQLTAPEDPGPWCFPPIAAAITAGARLLLMVVECLVSERQGTHAYMDTDSIFVVSTEEGGLVPCPNGPHHLPDGRDAVRALSWQEIDDHILTPLAALNPFDPTVVKGSILKIEDENFSADTGERFSPLFYGISAKRYSLFTHGDDGPPGIVKASDHGLGLLLDPTHTDPDDSEDDVRRFAGELWRYLIALELELPTREPDWLDLPAIGRIALSTPLALAAFKSHNQDKDYIDTTKPHGFAITCYIAPLGHPPDIDPQRFHLVAPYEREPTRWLQQPWFDLHTGRQYSIKTGNTADAQGLECVVKSYRDVLDQFCRHPEAKLADPNGEPCEPQTRGLLQRRNVWVAAFTHIGKETHDLEARYSGTVHDLDQVQADYGDPHATLAELVRKVLREAGTAALKESNLDRVTVWRFLNTEQKPRPTTLKKLTDAAVRHARKQLKAAGQRPPHDDYDCLATYIATRAPPPSAVDQ